MDAAPPGRTAMLGRNLADKPLEIFAHLQQRVHNGHQQGFETGNRAALPHFRLGHRLTSSLSRSSLLRCRDRLRSMAPAEYVPQLPTLATKTPPSGDEWVHEIKLDGYRVGCLIADGRVRLVSRRGLDWTSKFPKSLMPFARSG